MNENDGVVSYAWPGQQACQDWLRETLASG